MDESNFVLAAYHFFVGLEKRSCRNSNRLIGQKFEYQNDFTDSTITIPRVPIHLLPRPLEHWQHRLLDLYHLRHRLVQNRWRLK